MSNETTGQRALHSMSVEYKGRGKLTSRLCSPGACAHIMPGLVLLLFAISCHAAAATANLSALLAAPEPNGPLLLASLIPASLGATRRSPHRRPCATPYR
jgi:hypothetical protein